MKLQIAFDLMSANDALDAAAEIYDIIDIIEVGTPMIVREGMVPVRMLKKSYPDTTVLADVKIVDGGDIESADAFHAGADIVTVLAAAADETIKGVVSTAVRYGKKTMVDMIGISDIQKRAEELDALGVDYICIHTAVDVQGKGESPYHDLSLLLPVLKNSKAAVAGGVNMAAIPVLKDLDPEIVVAGSALTGQSDIRRAVLEMQDAIKGGKTYGNS